MRLLITSLIGILLGSCTYFVLKHFDTNVSDLNMAASRNQQYWERVCKPFCPQPEPTPTPIPPTDKIIGQCNANLAADAQVSFKIDTMKGRKEISPYIYGSNRFNFLRPDWKDQEKANWTIARSGGAGYNTFNWEINATNCGTSNNYLNVPWGITFNPEDYPFAGQGQGKIIEQIFQHKAAIVVTIPMFPYVAADRNWTDVTKTNNYINTRFKKNRARKGSPFTLNPDLNDEFVYQDEYVNWIEFHYGQKNHPENPPIFYQIDNEPSLWNDIFHHLDSTPWTYKEYINTYIEFASAIKDVNPDAIIIGGGFGSMQPLMRLEDTAQTPPSDWNGRDFIEFFLGEMRKAESIYDHRLIDVVDLHWYSQATYPDELQIARTLWDASFDEKSPFSQQFGNIRLIPRLKEIIARSYPDTKIALLEYNFYGTGIHAGIKHADILGTFGREGLDGATRWDLPDTGNDFVVGGFALYRNFDGKGGTFGDISIEAQNSDYIKTSAYSSIDSKTGNLVMVVINKTDQIIKANITLNNIKEYTNVAEVYQLTADQSMPIQTQGLTLVEGCGLIYRLPAKSATTIVLKKNSR